MKALLALVAVSLVGCASPYVVVFDGDVLGAEAETPRSVRSGVHEGRPAELQRIVDAAYGRVRPLRRAKVDVAFHFVGERRDRFTIRAPLEPETAKFRVEVKGRSHARLESVTFTAEAPGHEPVTRRFEAATARVHRTVLAILDPVGVPFPGPRGAARSSD